MRSPKDMQIIQIELTNACIHRCSNCTRMCGHHKKPFFMDWETFQRAVDSLDGFEGTIGIMGGEPTLHPEFERFSQYLASKYEPKKDNNFVKPTKKFMETLLLETRNRNYLYKERNGVNYRVKGPGLWSSLVSNYSRYYELIQDIFQYQCVNDHKNTCYHQPVLVARRDLGIPDEEWEALRSRCWVQNCWSASITPKGAFFCEIAAALDMLFDGPGGWPIEPDWWKRRPEDFKDQLHWCELCGLALDTRSRNANDETDDVSPTLFSYLKKIESPKLREGKVSVYQTEQEVNKELIRKNKYHDNEYNRISENNNTIFPKGFDGIVMAAEYGDYNWLRETLLTNAKQIERLAVIAGPALLKKLEREEAFRDRNKFFFIQDRGAFGINLNKARGYLHEDYYYILMNPEIKLNDDFTHTLKKYVINPGTYHVNDFGEEGLSLISIRKNREESPYLALFHGNAYALKRAGFDRVACCKSREEFEGLWENRKVLPFSDKLLKGNEEEGLEIRPGIRYAVFGTGDGGRRVTEMIRECGAQIYCYCDSREEKRGQYFMGYEILSPQQLLENRKEYDKIVIASVAYGEILEILRKLGFKEHDVVAPILD